MELIMCALRLEYNAIGFELYDDDRFLTMYRATEELPRVESPKPCFAPIYTPSGKLITEYRPPDHTWHTGLYFGWVHVNDANLWGGPWYLPERGKYEHVENSHGVQRHDVFSDVRVDPEEVALTDELTWLDQNDQPMASEKRRYTFSKISAYTGYLWTVDTTITPSVEQLDMGASKAARYSGLELRMGPPFADADHVSSEGVEGHEQIMGTHAQWVRAAGAEGGMVVMMDHPENPRHPVTWFTRKNLLGAGLLMEDTLTLRKTEKLHLRYGFIVLEDVITSEQIEALYGDYVRTS